MYQNAWIKWAANIYLATKSVFLKLPPDVSIPMSQFLPVLNLTLTEITCWSCCMSGDLFPSLYSPIVRPYPSPNFFQETENTNSQFTGCKSNKLAPPALLLELPLNIRAFTSRRYANINYMSSMYEVLLVFFPINQRVWITSRGSHTHTIKYPILEVARATNV